VYLKPVIAINYKAYYPHSFGEHCLRITRDAIRVKNEIDVEIILAPPFTELYRVIRESENTGVKVYAQHADPVEPGAATGYIPIEGLKEIGVHGVIINHSEHRLKISDINWLIKRAKKTGLETLVCADEPEIGAAIALLKPDMIAVEPPELIGTGISVSKAKPEVIVNSVDLIRKIDPSIRILTGAGITTGEDVYRALKLGTIGVLVASAIVKSQNPYSVIREMAVNAVKALNDS